MADQSNNTGEVNEADALEQTLSADPSEDDETTPPSVDTEVPEADALEQAAEVGEAEDAYPHD